VGNLYEISSNGTAASWQAIGDDPALWPDDLQEIQHKFDPIKIGVALGGQYQFDPENGPPASKWLKAKLPHRSEHPYAPLTPTELKILDDAAVQIATNVKAWCEKYKITYVDIDIEDLLPMKISNSPLSLRESALESEMVVQFMSNLSLHLKEGTPIELLSHAPMANYFRPMMPQMLFPAQTASHLLLATVTTFWAMYQRIDKQAGPHIDFYNIQFYNQADQDYGSDGTIGWAPYTYGDFQWNPPEYTQLSDKTTILQRHMTGEGQRIWPMPKINEHAVSGFGQLESGAKVTGYSPNTDTFTLGDVEIPASQIHLTPYNGDDPYTLNNHIPLNGSGLPSILSLHNGLYHNADNGGDGNDVWVTALKAPLGTSGPYYYGGDNWSPLYLDVLCTTLGAITNYGPIWQYEDQIGKIELNKLVLGKPGNSTPAPDAPYGGWVDLHVLASALKDTGNNQVSSWFVEGGTSIWQWPTEVGKTPEEASALDKARSNISNYFKAMCFMHGTTLIVQSGGTRKKLNVDLIKLGDMVLCERWAEEECSRYWAEVKYIEREPLSLEQYSRCVRILPKDAFKKGTPDADLHVTGGHGLLLKSMQAQWKNENYDENHVTYSPSCNRITGDYVKLLARDCALARAPNAQEVELARRDLRFRTYYHFDLSNGSDHEHHAIVSHGLASESLLRK
tara:strand:- start:584 stop:2617 length:2034 start_codon:yes stop_codon:yes gene_type:complete